MMAKGLTPVTHSCNDVYVVPPSVDRHTYATATADVGENVSDVVPTVKSRVLVPPAPAVPVHATAVSIFTCTRGARACDAL